MNPNDQAPIAQYIALYFSLNSLNPAKASFMAAPPPAKSPSLKLLRACPSFCVAFDLIIESLLLALENVFCTCFASINFSITTFWSLPLSKVATAVSSSAIVWSSDFFTSEVPCIPIATAVEHIKPNITVVTRIFDYFYHVKAPSIDLSCQSCN